MRVIATKLLRYFVGIVGGVVISIKAYNQLLTQRGRAVSLLASQENLSLKPGLTGVVFSKDRALQLYTLLYTYFKLVDNPVSLFIIYNASTAAHAKAYREVEDALKNVSVKVTFIRENLNFRKMVLDVLVHVNTKNLFFLVDDIIFIRPLNLELASTIDPLQSILSLRHSPHLRRSYTAATNVTPPLFFPSKEAEDVVCFKWFERGYEWSDPWSVDGQILSTAEVRVLTRVSDFKAPNTYEGTLKTFNDIAKARGGMCYTESKILNLPINRVQSEVRNYSGSTSAEYLLGQWNKGLMIDTSMFENHIPQSPHEEHQVTFVSRMRFPKNVYPA